VFAEDIDATYNELKSLGPNIVEPLERKPWGYKAVPVEVLRRNKEPPNLACCHLEKYLETEARTRKSRAGADKS